MEKPGWRILCQIQAGGIWAAVCDHPRVESVDRTHCSDHTSVGFWLSHYKNPSSGSFLLQNWRRGQFPLGTVVAIPAGIPLHVQSDESPARVMLHCRFSSPSRWQAETLRLEACLDMDSHIVRTSLARIAREVMNPGLGTSAIVEGLGLFIAGELERALVSIEALQRKGGLATWQLRLIDDYLGSGNWNCTMVRLQSCSVSRQATLCAHFDKARGGL
jgi:AraC family transcriptional regulator